MEFMLRAVIAGAVGAVVLVGTAGILLYQQLQADRRRMMLQRDVAQLNLTVAEMQRELDSLQRENQGRRSVRRKANNRSLSSADETDVDMYSAVGTDDGDEFFDFSDEDNDLDCQGNASETETDPRLVQLFDEVDRLLKGSAEDKGAAYDLLLEHEYEYADCVSVLWRLAKASHMMAVVYGAEGDLDKKKELVLQGVQYAERALELDESNAEAHKWFAVTVGSRGEFLSTREKIEDGSLFKEHVDKAVALQPDDPSLHHLLGRFSYEVANLSWLERSVARSLFAEPPTATFPEAVEHFMKAERLSPIPWKENRLLLAKCHISQSCYADAVMWLDRAAGVPVTTPDDQSAEKEVQSLLEKYGSYRNDYSERGTWF